MTRLLVIFPFLLLHSIIINAQSIDYDQNSNIQYNNPYTQKDQSQWRQGKDEVQKVGSVLNSIGNTIEKYNPLSSQNRNDRNEQYGQNNNYQPIGGPGPMIPHPQNSTYSPNSPQISNDNDFSIEVKVQLRSYLNAQSMLDNSKTCACNTDECRLVSPQELGFRCFFSFMVLVSSADPSSTYRSTEFLLLNNFGSIDSNYTNKFSELFTFNINHQPTAINVFVHNLGPVINAYSKKLEQANTVYHVDTFTHPLNSTTSVMSRGTGQLQQISLAGVLLGTQLGLSYSVSCKGSLIGPGCDLYCNSSSVNSNTAICTSKRTGFYSVCRWSGGKSQVTDCKNCPWGIRDNAYCMDESGGILEANHAGVVGEGFRTATIILGVLCGVFLIIIILVLVICCLRKPKQPRSTSLRSQQNYETEYLTHRNGDDIRPLNTSANPNNTFSTSASTATPQPAPRNQPPMLSAKPQKSVLRSPHLYQLPPASHLGGGANSLNSSFSSTIAPHVANSVSADV